MQVGTPKEIKVRESHAAITPLNISEKKIQLPSPSKGAFL